VPEPVPSLPEFDPASLVGTTLDGRYRVDEHLATGGMGAVFRACHVYMRKDVALKVLRPDLSASAELVERFRRESEIAASLEHDHIVRVTDFGRTPEGWLFLAMELLFGESLFDRLRREAFLPPEEAVPILWQVCAGLEAAHARGVVHRDLKPENVFLARTPGGREVAKILDFGIAKMADPSSEGATQAGMVVGTPEYLSPEQATGSPVDGRADLYTVGLIAWRMLAGRHPYKADEPRALLMMQATRPVPSLVEARADLAAFPDLVAAVTRACEKEPAARFQSAAEMKAALAAALGPAFQLAEATPAPAVSYAPLGSPEPGALAARSSSGTIRLGAAIPSSPALAPLPATPARPRRLGLAGWVAEHKALAAAAAGGALAAIVAAALLAASGGRAPAAPSLDAELLAARDQLAAGHPAQARAALEQVAVRRPDLAEVQRLLGHAYQDDGRPLQAVEAWGRVLAAGVELDGGSLEHLAGDLASAPPLSDKAARLLVRAGPPAGPALNGVIAHGATPVKLRALAVAREIGPASNVDVLGGYLALLGEPECGVRQAAARGLGELGDRRALPRLRERAAERNVKRGLFGVIVESKAVCGGPEAADAVKRLEAR
jgi:serine/threonine-protein kinase